MQGIKKVTIFYQFLAIPWKQYDIKTYTI